MVHSPMMNRPVEGRTPKSPPWGMAKLEGAKLVLGPAHSHLQAPRTGRCPPLPCHPNSSRLPTPALYPTLCSSQHPVQAFQGSCQMAACHLYPPLPSPSLSCSLGLCPEVSPSHHSAPSPPSSLCSHTRSSRTQFKMTAHFCHYKPPITCNCGSSASLAILPQAMPAIFTLHFVMPPLPLERWFHELRDSRQESETCTLKHQANEQRAPMSHGPPQPSQSLYKGRGWDPRLQADHRRAPSPSNTNDWKSVPSDAHKGRRLYSCFTSK